MELDKTEYLASTDDANVVERLVQAREQLKDCLMRGKAAVGYWQVQIHDDAIALIASQAAEVARLEALVVSRVRASADAIVEIASQAAEIAALKALLQSAYVRSSIEEGSPLGVEVCSYLRGYIP